MEHLLLKNLETLTSSTSHHSKTLTLTRSLLTSPNTSPSALQSIIETLAQALDRHRQDPTFARHAIKVIGDGAAHHRHLIPSAVGAIRPFLNAEHRVATDALAVVDSLGEYSVLDEELVVSLASSSAVSVRSRIVDVLGRNVDILRPELMMRVLLGIAADIYPLVRRGAVVGLTELLKRDGNWIDVSVVKRCYDCAVEHMRDEDGVLRSAVVRLVSECARLFTVTDAGNGGELVNMIFVQLCWMARDMSLKVRMDAIVALGNVRQVAESVLLQSLSKKILPSKNGGCSLTGCSIKESKYPLSSAAGAFVHGIEDEFHEVRTAACKSMGLLSKFSVQFSDDALSLLMDMLNDDVTAVRLQTLETLIHMALHDHLMVQEKHMHMFLGSLADNCAVIRHAARKVLRLMTLRKPEMFISSVDALITNLVMHPEEEDDIFCVLFFIGINHGNFAARRVKKFEAEIVPFCEGDLSLDSPQAAALLVLAISLSFSDEKLTSDVPPTIFSFAVPLLGRISRSLRDVIHPDLLLAHLGNRSELSLPSRAESLPCVVEDGFPNIKERTSQICSSSWSIRNKTLETSFKGNLFDLAEASTLFEQCREHDDNFIQSIKLIIRTVAETWQLMQSQHTHKVQRILRTCKGELETIAWNADGSIAALLAFALCYVQVIQLISEIWEQLQLKNVTGMTVLDLLLDDLELYLRRLRYSFSGFSIEQECHIIELTLLGYVLRLYKLSSYSSHISNKLQAVFSRVELFSEEQPLKFSEFYIELKKSYIEQRTGEAPNKLFPVQKLLQLFCLEQIPLSGELKQLKAEISVTGDNSEDPLPFVSGLPVGITFQITLYNISNKDRVWLRMAAGSSVQYLFLDLCQFEGSETASKRTLNLPFYATPNAASFLLEAYVCMECQGEDVVDCNKGQGGPGHHVTLLSEKIDIYLVQIENR